MSLHIIKLFKTSLALASVALVCHISAATAADSAGDIQQQVRDSLTGAATAHSAPQLRPGADNVASATGDSQEFVKQLLRGATISRPGAATTIKRSPHPQGDMQAEVRQLLLGEPYASDASQLAARATR